MCKRYSKSERAYVKEAFEESGRERGQGGEEEKRGRGEKRICPGTPENDSVGVKIIYGSHLRGCRVTVRPSLIQTECI